MAFILKTIKVVDSVESHFNKLINRQAKKGNRITLKRLLEKTIEQNYKKTRV
jgi:hypothetical protein